MRSVLCAVKERSGALAKAILAELSGVIRKLLSFKRADIKPWADSLLIVPPLICEGLSVNEAAQRSAKLSEPLRRKLAYPAFRRRLAFALVLTAWQVMVLFWGNTLDGGRRGPEAIEMLLAAGVDINEQTRFGTPLLAAARYQSLYPRVRLVTGRQDREYKNAVKILLEKGADPNTRDSEGRNALMVMSMEQRSSDDQRERSALAAQLQRLK